MNGITSSLELAQNSLQEFIHKEEVKNNVIEEVNKDLCNSLEACANCVDILNNMLELASVRRTAIPLHNTMFNASKLCRSVLANVGKKRGVEIRSEVKDGLSIFGDQRRLRQVLVNLLSNACKATEKGFVCVSITAEGDVLEDKLNIGNVHVLQGTVTFCVRDTGCGLPPELQERLFEAFQSSFQKGTGLGLVLCQKYVTAMGGQIEVEKPVVVCFAECILQFESPWQPKESGAKVAFSLQTQFEENRAIEASLPREQSSCSSLLEFSLPSKWKVLIVDDIRLNRSLMRRKLTRSAPFAPLEWEIHEAASGEEALEMIASPSDPPDCGRTQFDFLILDHMLGNDVMLGSQVAQEVRKMYSVHTSILPGSSASSTASATRKLAYEPLMLDLDFKEVPRDVLEKHSVLEWEHERKLKHGPIIIACTGNVTQAFFKEFRESGMDWVWGKPIPSAESMMKELNKLYHIIVTECARRDEKRASAMTTSPGEKAVELCTISCRS